MRSENEIRSRELREAVPEREASGRAIVIEAQDVVARHRLHDREADGVRERDRARREPIEPPAGGRVVRGRGKVNIDARTGVYAIQCPRGRPDADSKEREAMCLGDHEVRRHELDVPLERLAEQPIRLDVVLIAPTAQRDPRAAIDEQSGGRGAVPGTVRAARQRNVWSR